MISGIAAHIPDEPKPPAVAVGSSDGLAELRARFPKARLHFPPTPDCKRCSGTGVEAARTLPSGTKLNAGPCACLFFGENTTWLAGLLAKTAREALSANGAGEPQPPKN